VWGVGGGGAGSEEERKKAQQCGGDVELKLAVAALLFLHKTTPKKAAPFFAPSLPPSIPRLVRPPAPMEARDGEAGPSGRGSGGGGGAPAAATATTTLNTKRTALANAGSSSPVSKKIRLDNLQAVSLPLPPNPRRAGIPPPTSTSAFVVPDRSSPPLRGDDKARETRGKGMRNPSRRCHSFLLSLRTCHMSSPFFSSSESSFSRCFRVLNTSIRMS